ncbi:MAG: DUF4160 domain-containing protein [Chloroflexota bacterium]|nr:DUF4160 domain-containing protein [Chloroflexota bacterium]
MVKVVQRGRFSVYVYVERGERHHLPHCHVYWSDGESVVSLRDAELLRGDPVPPAARTLVREHLRDIRRAWDRLNPEETAQ